MEEIREKRKQYRWKIRKGAERNQKQCIKNMILKNIVSLHRCVKISTKNRQLSCYSSTACFICLCYPYLRERTVCTFSQISLAVNPYRSSRGTTFPLRPYASAVLCQYFCHSGAKPADDVMFFGGHHSACFLGALCDELCVNGLDGVDVDNLCTNSFCL